MILSLNTFESYLLGAEQLHGYFLMMYTLEIN